VESGSSSNVGIVTPTAQQVPTEAPAILGMPRAGEADRQTVVAYVVVILSALFLGCIIALWKAMAQRGRSNPK
jgi:cellobiose-specific phosphotransferase system component IIC